MKETSRIRRCRRGVEQVAARGGRVHQARARQRGRGFLKAVGRASQRLPRPPREPRGFLARAHRRAIERDGLRRAAELDVRGDDVLEDLPSFVFSACLLESMVERFVARKHERVHAPHRVSQRARAHGFGVRGDCSRQRRERFAFLTRAVPPGAAGARRRRLERRRRRRQRGGVSREARERDAEPRSQRLAGGGDVHVGYRGEVSDVCLELSEPVGHLARSLLERPRRLVGPRVGLQRVQRHALGDALQPVARLGQRVRVERRRRALHGVRLEGEHLQSGVALLPRVGVGRVGAVQIRETRVGHAPRDLDGGLRQELVAHHGHHELEVAPDLIQSRGDVDGLGARRGEP